MPRISVIVPTHNRQELLVEALRSVAAQTHRDHEVVVVDDGSTPAVDAGTLSSLTGLDIKLMRNEASIGQASSRERGEALATGDFVLQLDDDDLLAPDLMRVGLEAFDANPGLGVLMFNVQGFGARAESFQRAQDKALAGVLAEAGVPPPHERVTQFGPRLFGALLQSVPMAFQRPLARRSAWREVTQLRRAAYGQAHGLRPPLRESEWAIYASASQRIGLVHAPLYLQRCEEQGYFSIARKRDAYDRAIVEVLEHLLRFAAQQPQLASERARIRRALAQRHFNQAHAGFHAGAKLGTIWRAWWRAVSTAPNGRFLKFGLRMVLPRPGAGNGASSGS